MNKNAVDALDNCSDLTTADSIVEAFVEAFGPYCIEQITFGSSSVMTSLLRRQQDVYHHNWSLLWLNNTSMILEGEKMFQK